jgi:4-hydroxy-tetrahydrodipicolinate synthase
MTRLQGCGTALVTPFTPDNAVDEPALRALVRWQIDEGMGFLVPCGSTGEAQTMTAAERERVVAIVVEEAAGRVPVMAGATSNDTAVAVSEARRMSRLGVDYILTATPYYNKPTAEGLFRHFSAIADASERPICLYNIPGRSGVNLRPATALRLAEHPNVIGIKESSGDLAQIRALLYARPARFAVLSGDDWLALPIIALGGDGLISVAGNEAPRFVSDLVRFALRGELDTARALDRRLAPLMDANFIETNPAPVKAALHRMGRIHNVLRLPLVPATEGCELAIAEALAPLGIRPPADVTGTPAPAPAHAGR